MRRRNVLAGAGLLAAGASLSFPAPAIAQGIRQLKMVTDWPEALPGLQTSAVRFAETVAAATGGRIKVEVFPSGAFVSPFETFDAVGAGVADLFHTFEGYFERKSPAFHFFAAIPFGFSADELFAWVQYGGGQELWDTLSGQFNVKSLLCSNTGCQMGGWFTREITSPDGFKGLRYRMGAPAGAEVLRRLGAIVVTYRSASSQDHESQQARAFGYGLNYLIDIGIAAARLRRANYAGSTVMSASANRLPSGR
jgi:TRAP-type mannitol/chloroaromatic compound transport system substrate-binding protein